MLVAGIDGGQSSTTAAIVDGTGFVLARGTAGPCDHVDQGPRSRRFADAVENALADAMRAAQLPVDTAIDAVVGGISGFAGTIHGVAPRLPSNRVRFVHDAPIALAGALAGSPGMIILSGTGSVVYAETADGRALLGGGWGHLFGDAGSSFALARDAIAAAMAAEDAGGTSPLGDAARAYFDVPDLRALQRAVAIREIDRQQLASFARVVCDAARIGSPEARDLVTGGVRALATLAAHVATRLHVQANVAAAFVGGTFGSPWFRAAARDALAEALPGAHLVEPRYDPVLGAAILAFRDAGFAAVPDFKEAARA